MGRLTYKSSWGDYGSAVDWADEREEIMALKDAEAEKIELLQRLDEIEAEHKKRLKTANTERQRLLKKSAGA